MKRLIIFFKKLFGKKNVPNEPNVKKLNHHLYALMRDGEFFTLDELKEITGCKISSISSALRDFRKERNGSNEVIKERVNKIYKYSLIINPLNNILEKRNRKNK
jgi:hypothetical protein